MGELNTIVSVQREREEKKAQTKIQACVGGFSQVTKVAL